jgi:DNA primase
MTLSNIHLTPQLVQAVRDAVDIVDVAGEHTRLRKAGRRHSGLCPLHREKTPSFSVDPDEGLFYCFGCGRGGDAIKLYMLLSGDDFPAAIEALAQRYGIPLPKPRRDAGGRGYRQERDIEGVLKAAATYFSQQLEASPDTRGYLEKRQIPQETSEKFGLGYAPEGWRNLLEALQGKYSTKDLEAAGLIATSERTGGKQYDRFRHRLMFPIRTAAGRLVGFGGRTLGDDRAKYVNTSETERFQKGYLLYGLDVAKREIREAGSVLLVEGYFDVLGAAVAGVETAVASMGTSLTPDQARLLARYADEVIVGYDGDAAGEQAFRRAVPIMLAQGLTVRRADFGRDHDPDSLRMEKGPEAVIKAVEKARDAVEMEFERLIPEGVLNDPKKQAAAAKQIGELLRSIPDSVLRYSYGRQAADGLGIPVDLLWRRVGQKPDAKPKRTESDDRSPQIVRSLEELVLQLLLSGDAELPSPEDLPSPDAFLIPACRNIYGAFCVLYRDRAPGRPSVQEVLGRVPHEGTEVDQVARLLLEGSSALRKEDLDKALERMSRRWLQQRLRGLSSKISAAQRSGDEALMERLVREKTALSRALHRGVSESNNEKE